MADQSADLVPLVAKYLSSAGLNKTLKALKKEVKLDSVGFFILCLTL